MLTLEMAIQKIQLFSPEQRNKVIEFIEFLEFQASQTKTIEPKNDIQSSIVPQLRYNYKFDC